ncbi:membrane hypothetical protein [Candidatus Nitrospira nitrosa]|uniref:DUF805 domain-containing protein n=1 Tax=Candidatus Nitrospira nitrosa TaxID=1742972 RepID=A0A0S4LB22_9BACT|nr:DUF805 domain-containing protein [Candidatus Nitrospira nitrosa]CUS33824.1 membrane hypothetical protein [Candidatus Nitrospira nitrosa]
MNADIGEADINTGDRISRSSRELAIQLAWLLFSIEGRLGRRQYFLSIFFVSGVPLLGYFGFISFAGSGITTISDPFNSNRSADEWLTSVAFIPAAAVWAWASLATTFKRLHDFGKSTGTFMVIAVISLIPGASGLAFFYLLLNPGDSHANKYGEGPGWNSWSRERDFGTRSWL